ncbi:hypothetical protein RUND412_004683 [Rhizina undulata]
MKVLNPREAFLSNHEVLEHITAMKKRYTAAHEATGAAATMKSENLETVMKEVIEYLSTTPAQTQSPENIQAFMLAMSKFPLQKAELLTIINMRPNGVAELDCIIEEMEQRFNEDETAQVLEIVKANLPKGPEEAGRGGEDS